MDPSMDQNADSGKPAELMQHVERLTTSVRAAVREGSAAHQVEQAVWRQILDLGRSTMEMFFELVGDGDMGEEVQTEDGRRLRRLAKLHDREYRTVFGRFVLPRAVYGTREGQKIEFVPLDTRLQLPEGRTSYLLQDWSQSLAVEEPFATSGQTLEKILGFSQPVDTLERMNQKMSELVPDFWDSLSTPAASQEGELMVVTADGKGVPMRRPANQAPIEGHQPSKGPKPDTKKMALLGGSHTVDRLPRTPTEVSESLFGGPEHSRADKSRRPQPRHKRVRASLQRSEQGTTEPAVGEIFSWLAAENQARNPTAEKPLVVLMDGQRSLWDATGSYLPQGANTVEILDLLHVTPRLWKAAKLFHSEHHLVMEFIKARVLRILNGEVRAVITGLRRMGTGHGLRGNKLKALNKICGYLQTHRHRMRYGEYLAAGYPIATGVIEGACRHLVKDRMERSGMRWGLQGAQAMLDLRSIYIAAQWTAFIAFRIRKENQRLYPYANLTQGSAWPIAA